MGSEVKKEAGLPPCPPRSAQAKLRWRLLSRAIVPSRQGAEDVYARANLRSGNDFDATNSSENSSKNISKNINKKSVILQFVTYQKESRSNTRDDE
ncbi:hypothetical protein R1sor_000461 [Riccia sorocarpa]|uniref:Uncharacterized protein n=1 Tax=Riccia sorocarpa TaxID=122646 RepID=A0ABD3GVP0_9MARC